MTSTTSDIREQFYISPEQRQINILDRENELLHECLQKEYTRYDQLLKICNDLRKELTFLRRLLK